MSRFRFVLVGVLLVAMLAGCGGGDTSDNGDGTPTDGDGTTPEAQQWAAYAFDQVVDAASGGSGTVESFTIVETYNEDGEIRKFSLDGTYLGTGGGVKTARFETDLSTAETTETTVTTPIPCHQVKHRVTVLQDDTGEEHPDWADVTVYIPTGDFETSVQYFWIYPMAEYEDSMEREATWSYYVSQAMTDEMSSPPAGKSIMYMPYVDGEFYGYDEWALWGLYGWAWFWFDDFATGMRDLEEGSYSFGGFSYSVGQVDKTVGDYTFDAWSINVTYSTGGESGGYQAILCDDLPLPIYLKVGQSGGDDVDYFEYELTDIALG